MMRRGHALVLMMVILAACGVAFGVFVDRFTLDLQQRKQGEVRTQALWLARSALDTGQAGQQRVQTPHGEAVVRMSAEGCTVELAGGRATITRTPWTERYTTHP